MKTQKGQLAFFFIATMLCSEAVSQSEWSGDVSATTTYVWRGIKQFHGAALQGTVCLSKPWLALGLFYSSLNFTDYNVETDPFVEIRWPGGIVSGIILYCYNFKAFNATANAELETSIKYNYKNFYCAGFYVPEQPSMDYYQSIKGYSNSSVYWLEGLYSFSVMHLTWKFGMGFGTYSSRFVKVVEDNPVGLLMLSATKPVTEAVSVNWNYNVSLNKVMEDTFWVVVFMSF